MRGRKPIPLELKGGGAPLKPTDFTSLECPEWIDTDAKIMWNRLGPELCEMGLLGVTLIEAFAAYCQCWSQWKLATEKVRSEGLTVATGRGMTRIHPAASYAADMARQMRSYAAEFGLTPASRARAGAPAGTTETDDALDQFLDQIQERPKAV